MTSSAGTRASLLAATVAVAAAFLLFVPLAGATPRPGLQLSKANAVFPERKFALALPDSRALQASDVTVTENGHRVSDFRLESASSASNRTFGVVLVLDTSASMRGEPLAAALTAMQSFPRNANEQLGVIYFNKTTTTALPLTTDQAKITDALSATPVAAPGTHIFDAVARAVTMLRAGHISSGSIIVLSDGADTGSEKSLLQVAHSAAAANARIYTVGIEDESYSPKTLTKLATAGRGEYVQRKAKGLASLFAEIGRVLSSQYLLTYTSRFGEGHHLVRVDVNVAGLGTATTAYRTPRFTSVTQPVSPPSVGTRIWRSSIVMDLLVVVLTAAIGLLLAGLFSPRRSRLPARIAEFVSIPELQRGRGPTTAPAAAVGEAAERMEEKDSWSRFRETLEIARIDAEPEVFVVVTLVATILVFFFIFAVTGGSVLWGMFALLVPVIAREIVLRALKRQRSRFAEQLPDALQVIGSALRSGHSFAGSLAVVVESASEPMRRELQRVVTDEQLGMPIERSLRVVADRMVSSDVEQLALVAELQRQAGGATAEVIDRVAETVRERFDLKRLIDTLTTQGRMSRWIVSALPIAVIIVLQLVNPGYFHPLIASLGGQIVVGVAAAWAVLGSLMIKRIVEIEV